MSYTRDYILTYKYITGEGREETDTEVVHSYKDGFQALNTWLWKNRSYDYMLISATIKEI